MPTHRVTVSLYMRKDKKRKDGTAPVYVRATANRKSRYVATGVYLEPKHWNADRGEVRRSHELADALNHELRRQLHEAQTAALEQQAGKKGGARAVQATLRGESAGSMIAYLDTFIERLDAAGRYWEWKKYRTLKAKLQECFGETLDWGELDRDGLIRFERFLRDVKKNNPNTVQKAMQRLGRAVKHAVRDGVLKQADNAFLIYEKPKGQKPDRRKLTLKEVHKLAEADLTVEGLGTAGKLAVARDAFLLAFYGGGVRFGDVCQLRTTNVQEKRLSYRMMKTGNAVSVPLPAPALAIVERYAEAAEKRDGFIFPFLEPGDDADGVHLRRRINSNNVMVNANLKRLAKRAGIEPEGLSFHVARHTFADYARQKSGDVFAVSKALGHSSLNVTQQYLRSFDRDAVDDLAKKLWD